MAKKPTATEAPASVKVAIVPGGVLVKWDKVEGAKGYKVSRGGSFIAQVGDVSEFKDTGHASGVQYVWYVAAVGETGDSERVESNPLIPLPE